MINDDITLRLIENWAPAFAMEKSKILLKFCPENET